MVWPVRLPCAMPESEPVAGHRHDTYTGAVSCARVVALVALLVIPSAIGVRWMGRADAEMGPTQTVVATATDGERAVTAEVQPMTATRGQPVTITIVVRGATSRVVAIGFELYDPVGGRAFRRFWDRQALSTGQALRRQTAWTVPSDGRTGDWTAKVRVFDPGWRRLTRWNEPAAPIFAPRWGERQVSSDAEARLSVRLAPVPSAARGAVTAASPPIVAPDDATVPVRFGTLPPGADLPSGTQCGAWVRARSLPERKGMNRVANQVIGHRLGPGFFDPGANSPAANRLAARVDGAFTGTTEQILRWAACKWGVDEDLVRAQAAVESWWRQITKGDWAGERAACPPGHDLGVDGRPGECPQSYGILQNRYRYARSAWPGIGRSTAMNADTAYAIWRACFEGYERWLNDVERGRHYGPGDAWGCVGRWFSGRWHTKAAEDYISKVKGYLDRRVWEQPHFQEPD